ncbi:MAG: hypothetical protein ACI92I_000778 [Acidimicrobiales bacterium]|jgi:hypothetical protein
MFPHYIFFAFALLIGFGVISVILRFRNGKAWYRSVVLGLSIVGMTATYLLFLYDFYFEARIVPWLTVIMILFEIFLDPEARSRKKVDMQTDEDWGEDVYDLASQRQRSKEELVGKDVASLVQMQKTCSDSFLSFAIDQRLGELNRRKHLVVVGEQ